MGTRFVHVYSIYSFYRDYVLVSKNLLYQYQFGFRHNHSTIHALIAVVDNIYNHLDKKEVVVGIYIDLQKAFDTVNHEILLYKLQRYGVRGIAYDWLVSYLSNRRQYCLVNKKTVLSQGNRAMPQLYFSV